VISVDEPVTWGLGRLPMRAGTAQLAVARGLSCPRPVDTTTGVWARVSAIAAADPRRTAVVTADGRLSYRQLAGRARQFEAALRVHRCGPGDRVAVVGPRSADTIAAFLAIESLGAAYLPVDPTWPAERTAGVLQHSVPRCLLVLDRTQRGADEARTAAAEAGVPVAGPPELTARMAPPRPARLVADDEPRYVIHTSGSTGRPKGAVVVQTGLMNHLWSMVDRLRLTPADRIAFSAPPVYVISVWQMLAGLLVGGSVVVVDETDLRFARRLVAHAARTRVTVMELVPTVIGWLVDQLGRTPGAGMPRLRCLISTGEKLTPQLVARVMRTLPRLDLLNAYGSTECSDDVCLHVVQRTEVLGSTVPAGTPIPNAVLYLLVDEGGLWRAAEPGEPGELWVGGMPVSAGYLHDPDLTAAAFFVDEISPGSRTGRLYRTGDLATFQNGLVYVRGRADRQVKVAGVRIELDEIEAHVSRIADVAACAAVVQSGTGQPELVVYYVAQTDTPEQAVHASLRRVLPPSMLPRRWIRLLALPRNANGKVDYRALGAGACN
jgi:amino acid adenylation domain-containing protein